MRSFRNKVVNLFRRMCHSTLFGYVALPTIPCSSWRDHVDYYCKRVVQYVQQYIFSAWIVVLCSQSTVVLDY